MKIKLNDLLIVLFLVLISFVLKKLQLIPLASAIAVIFFGEKIDSGIKNLIYAAIATLPLIPFFIFFIFYIPFVIFGTIFENASFIKKYVFAMSVTLVLRLAVFHANMIGIPISEYFIMTTLIVFLLVSYYIFIKKKGIASLKNVFSVSSEDYKILIITLFFLFAVAGVIYNNSSLYQSNATQIYAKQLFVIDGIEKFWFFPLYDPSIGMGEQLFLTDSPAHFTKDILILTTIFLRDIFGAVLIYNAYSMFVLWIVILGASLLLKEVLSINNSSNSDLSLYFIILGSIAIGLSFQFVRILESFKSFSAHTINFLLLALILSKPKKAAEWFAIAYLMLFSYMVHVIQSIGIFILAASLLVVLYWRDRNSIKSGFDYILKNKLRVAFAIALFIGIMFSYTITGYIYKDYVREHPKGIFNSDPMFNFVDYFSHYFNDPNTTPFSIKYPELNRIDTKQSGFFLSVIGGLSFLFILFNFKNEKLNKARLFNLAFLLHFMFYAVFIVSIFNFGNLEPGYRIIHPYTVVVLAASIAVAFDSFRLRYLRLALLLVFFVFLANSLYYARINMNSIHSEAIISGGVMKDEIEFIKSLPIDGRFITYGFFANAVDAGLASTTGHYFTRYQYNLWSEKNNIYEKVHTQNSFGDFEGLYNLSGAEFRNYWALGGYKYVFANACHPVGNFVISKVYPDYSMPLYQNPNNQCFVILKVNNATYADKASVLKSVDENVYKTEEGYKYISISSLGRYGFNPQEILKNAPENPINPIELSFKRSNPHEAVINGEFKNGDWVNFKEEYFPRWKAYMNGKEISVYPTNFNMILIKAIDGNSITLRYEISKIGKIFNLISLIAVILCSILFILLLKYEFD